MTTQERSVAVLVRIPVIDPQSAVAGDEYFRRVDAFINGEGPMPTEAPPPLVCTGTEEVVAIMRPGSLAAINRQRRDAGARPIRRIRREPS